MSLNMHDLYESADAALITYHNSIEDLDEKLSALYEKEAKLRKRADKALQDAEKIKKQMNEIERPDRIDLVVKPLAAELQSITGKKCVKVLGPSGLRCEVFIDLYDEETEYLHRVERSCLTLTPYRDEEMHFILYYDTEEETEYKCPKGSIGELNGMNILTKPLPDSIEEIVPLLRTVKPLM